MVAVRSRALDKLRHELREIVAQSTQESVGPIFESAKTSRIPMFADYYFSYATNLFLLKEAISVVASHRLMPGAASNLSTQDVVAARLEALLLDKYEHVVLRPEINQAPLQAAFERVAQVARDHFVEGVDAADDELYLELVRTGKRAEVDRQKWLNSTHYGRATGHISLDWRAHARKVRHVPSAVGSSRHASAFNLPVLALGGAFLGKAAGGVAAKAVTTSLVSKLAAPFAAKATVAAAAGGAGAAAASVFAGPVGAIAGGTMGLMVDMSLNMVHGLLHREELLRELEGALEASEKQCVHLCAAEVNRAVDEWIQEAHQRCKPSRSSS
eukprot:TRINITY_DN75496_c0_g1_i1.p1 TRINITY_DN75496_c0_g1~~TRINITY_DN75496_c0_g1_i1.p1  ORF type:complete len:378 (-),score=64.00 TRINITY_DN75496_c0_g1_i1:23-1006(-)